MEVAAAVESAVNAVDESSLLSIRPPSRFPSAGLSCRIYINTRSVEGSVDIVFALLLLVAINGQRSLAWMHD